MVLGFGIKKCLFITHRYRQKRLSVVILRAYGNNTGSGEMSNGTFIKHAATGNVDWFSRDEIAEMLSAADFIDIEDAVFSIPSKLAEQTWTYLNGHKAGLQDIMAGALA